MVNHVLVLSGMAWAVAQVLKFLIYAAAHRELNWGYLLTGGGMPSSHSAFVCACAASVAFVSGPGSPIFAVSVVLALIVMYDAANVRRETGQQAKVLNHIMECWAEMKPEEFSGQLKELVGHTWMQVAAGAVLGVLVGVAGCLLWR